MAVALSMLLFAVTLAGCSSSANSDHTATTATRTPISQVPTAPSGSTLLATFHADTPSSSVAGGPVTGTVPATWHSAPSVLPVIASAGGEIEVRLAQRPNESTAWVPASSATFTSTPYRIVVDLATTHVTLFEHDQEILSAPAGIGIPKSPTPTGSFFVAFLAQPPSSGYGPFVMVTSAHSDSITDWEESGDAMIAIHGPLGAQAAIGTTGAAVSHGCIRLQLTDLSQLRVVPVGSPVDIVDQ